jgi:tRNA acetyltransferase TAN1
MSDAGKRKHDGGRDDQARKKAFWSDVRLHTCMQSAQRSLPPPCSPLPPPHMQNSKAKGLPLDSRGVLVSGWSGKEMAMGRDAVSILTEAYEALGGVSEDGNDASDADVPVGDISAMLASEVAELKDRSKQPFHFITLGMPSLVYVRIKYEGGPGPVALVARACADIKESGQAKSRLITRFHPVEYVCAATVEDLENLGKKVAAAHFPADGEGTTFSVEFEKRAGGAALDRMSVINAFANEVPQPPHKVNLGAPAKSVLVNVAKGSVGVAVVDDFKGLARFNLRMLTGEEDEEEWKSGGGSSRAAAAKKKQQDDEES